MDDEKPWEVEQLDGVEQPKQLEPSTGGRTELLGLGYRWASILCYVPLVFLNVIAPIAFLLTEPKSNKIVRFHCIQGLCLAGVWLALALINSIVMSMLSLILGALAFSVMGFNSGVITLLVVIVSVFGIYRLYNGKDYRLPVIADFADQRA